MRSDVVLINPHVYVSKEYLDDFFLHLPIALGSLGAAVREAGYSVEVIDALAEDYYGRRPVNKNGRSLIRIGMAAEELRRRLQWSGARVVGIGNSYSAFFSSSVECAAITREALPDAKIILGGIHPSSLPEEIALLPEVDYVVRGEGEITFPEMIRQFEAGNGRPVLPGVYWEDNGKVNSGDPNENIFDLDSLPRIAYDLLDLERYRKASETDFTCRSVKGSFTLPLITSRGCSFRCTFCAGRQVSGTVWRGRSPVNVVDEIEFLVRKYDINSFSIEDDNFNYDEERAVEICGEIIKRGLDIRWKTPHGLRADLVSPRLVAAMKRAGCHEVALAAEHGDQEYLNRVLKKSINLDTIFQASAMFQKEGIPVTCYLIMGFHGETDEQMARTSDFARRLARAGILPYIAVYMPLPGSPDFDHVKRLIGLGSGAFEPEELFNCHRVSVIKNPAATRRRLRTLRRAYSSLMLLHPVKFFRFPAVSHSLKSLLSPRRFKLVVRKVYNHLVRRS